MNWEFIDIMGRLWLHIGREIGHLVYIYLSLQGQGHMHFVWKLIYMWVCACGSLFLCLEIVNRN